MEVETKGPVMLKSDKRSKESYGDGDIIEADVEEVLKADKKRKRKADHDGYETKKLKEDPVFEIVGNQSLNKQNKNSAKKQKVKVEKKISSVVDVLDNFSLGGAPSD